MARTKKITGQEAATNKKVAKRQPGYLGLRSAASIIDEMSQMREEITRRAYEIFSGRGFGGHELEDWVQAEHELTWKPPIELIEQNGALKLRAAVAGFQPEDLDVRVTPEDILIQSDRVHEGKDAGADVYRCDFKRGKLFCDVRLPKPVDPKKAEAEYHNGLLSITAPITQAAKGKRVKIAGS